MKEGMSVTPSGRIVADVVGVNAAGGGGKRALSFAVFGDPHVYSSRPDRTGFEGFEKYQRSRMYWPTDMAFREMVKAINRAAPDFAFGLGDMADFDDEQFQWLEADLTSHRGVPTFLFCHRPLSHVPFIRMFEEQGRELTSGEMYKFASPRREFFDLLTRHGSVQIVFSGSVHFSSECRIQNTIQRTVSGAFDGSYILVECY